jgi:hypothetical protein
MERGEWDAAEIGPLAIFLGSLYESNDSANLPEAVCIGVGGDGGLV